MQAERIKDQQEGAGSIPVWGGGAEKPQVRDLKPNTRCCRYEATVKEQLPICVTFMCLRGAEGRRQEVVTVTRYSPALPPSLYRSYAHK